jgi:photosystem II stability/assembly factor-like uncharacterized protein
MKKPSSVFLYIFLLVISLSIRTNFAQDDPNIDNTMHLTPPPSTPVSSPLGREVITSSDGFDNFHLGTDFAEPHISANPNNPTQYFNAFNTNATHYTFNGVDWTFQIPAFGSNMRGDPVTAYDSLGNLYYENMFGAGAIEGCKVIVSTDNGATWSPAVTAIAGVDKNWIAADQTSGPYANYVYTTMTAGNGVGRFARSTNLGVSWQTTFTPSTQSLPGMMVAVGPNTIGGDVPGGAVYVVTNSGNSFASNYTFYLSTDGGQNFNQQSFQSFAGYVGSNVNGRNSVENMRTRPYPFIAADNSYGLYRGRLYLVYASNTPAGNGNKPDIFCRYSTNQGVSWSSAVVINDDPNTTTHNQWMPAIWCDKETGKLYAKWFDTRNVPTSDSAEVYASYSDDGGITWSENQNLSTSKFKIDCSTCGGGGTPRYQGDYDAITSNSVTSMAVWSDFRYGNFGSFVAYFPDFAMTVAQTADTVKPNESVDIVVTVPAVKLYDNTVKFTTVSEPPANFIYEYPQGGSLTSFPDSVILRINANNVASDHYNIRIFGSGPNGTPVHERTVELLVTDPLTTVLQPNGGETLYVGTAYPIRWESIFVDTVNLEYSTDSGSSWVVIENGVSRSLANSAESDSPFGINQYDWVIPNTTSANCLLRISDTNDPLLFDVSDSPFTIEAGPVPGWTEQSSGVSVSINCVDIVDTSLAWAGTSDGQTLKTTDGGQVWQPTIGSPGSDISSISALSEQKAFVTIHDGNTAQIKRTVFSGISWSTVYENTDPDAKLNSVVMLNEDVGYAIGDPIGGQWLILKTTDGGTNWNDISTLSQNGTEKGLSNSAIWLDDMNGWFGTNNSSTYRTTDGGLTWTSSATTFQTSRGVSFTDMDNGVVAGEEINWTTDGGNSWFTKTSQLSGEVVSTSASGQIPGKFFFVTGNEVYITNNNGDDFTLNFSQTETLNFIDMDVIQVGENHWITGYTVGDNGTISKYKELYLVTDVKYDHAFTPGSFSLEQNYPNPFNPNTRIRYNIEEMGLVTLKIYDVLGNEVMILVNEEKPSGSYEVNFIASSLTSGIYFYQLKVGSFIETKKMVLLK